MGSSTFPVELPSHVYHLLPVCWCLLALLWSAINECSTVHCETCSGRTEPSTSSPHSSFELSNSPPSPKAPLNVFQSRIVTFKAGSHFRFTNQPWILSGSGLQRGIKDSEGAHAEGSRFLWTRLNIQQFKSVYVCVSLTPEEKQRLFWQCRIDIFFYINLFPPLFAF